MLVINNQIDLGGQEMKEALKNKNENPESDLRRKAQERLDAMFDNCSVNFIRNTKRASE